MDGNTCKKMMRPTPARFRDAIEKKGLQTNKHVHQIFLCSWYLKIEEFKLMFFLLRN